MSTDVDRMFEPSFLGWVGLVPQMLRSRGSREDATFLDRFSKMKQLREDLKRIERGIEHWTVCTTKLSNAAKELGLAVGTPNQQYTDTVWKLNVEIKDTSALQHIKEKISMIDTLIAQRTKLKYIKLKGEYAEHRLRQLRNKENAESFQALSEKYLTVQKAAKRSREEIMEQMLLVVDKYVAQAEEHGVSDLVKAQLQAFKLSQFHVFLSCQKLITGPVDTTNSQNDIKELEEHWNEFTARIANEIPNHRAGGSFVQSARQLQEKLVGSNQEGKKGIPSDKKAQLQQSYRDSDFDGENLSDVEKDDDHKDKGSRKDPGEETDIEDDLDDKSFQS